MIIPIFKIATSGFILTIGYIGSIIVKQIFYSEKIFAYREVYLLSLCIIGLGCLLVLYFMWQKEIDMFYKSREGKKVRTSKTN